MGSTGSAAAEKTSWSLPAAAGQVGVAVVDITPPAGILARNWGSAVSDLAAGVHRPLRATALALRSDDGVVRYLVTTDLGWWRRAIDEWSVRSRVLEVVGCAPEHLLIHLVHTHSGPTLDARSTELVGADLVPAYLDMLAERIAEAARRAAATCVEATASFTSTRCTVAVDRALVADGRNLLAFNPNAAADDTMLVGRITDLSGVPLAILVNYACHPTTLGWQPPMISPDWVGAARELVENSTDAPCLVLQGASGELSPREQYGDVALTDSVGRAIGHAALSGLATMPQPAHRLVLSEVVESGAALGIWRAERHEPSRTSRSAKTVVELGARPARSPAELADRHTRAPTTAAAERLRRAAVLREGYVDGDVARHPVWVWRWGDAVVIAQPGECYSWLQRELRRRHPDLAIFVLNCTNGPGFVYLPPSPVYDTDVYQVWQSEVVAGSLERIAAAADEVIESWSR